MTSTVRYFCVFLLLFFANFASITCDCYQDAAYAILRPDTEWALSGGMSPNVSIYQYDGSSTQQWSIDCAERPGLFYITNKASGERLAATDDKTTRDYGYEVELTQPTGSLWEEWFINPDGHIFNAAILMYLQIKFDNLENGAPVSLWNVDPPRQKDVWTLYEQDV